MTRQDLAHHSSMMMLQQHQHQCTCYLIYYIPHILHTPSLYERHNDLDALSTTAMYQPSASPATSIGTVQENEHDLEHEPLHIATAVPFSATLQQQSTSASTSIPSLLP